MNTSKFKDCLEQLKKVNWEIHRQEIIQGFNDNSIDYFTMSDLDMYIYFIDNNLETEENGE